MHRAFFPLFALLETSIHVPGAKVVAQRKLLFLEKLIASLLVAAPRLKDQLQARIESVKVVVADDLIDSCKIDQE